MKRFAALILLALFFCTSSCAEDLKTDLDLTPLSGNILMNAADEIQSSPERYAGQTVRLQGQFYASVSENQIRRSLILTECSGNTCREIGMKLVPAEGFDPVWPENNAFIEITASIQEAESAYGTKIPVLHVLSVRAVSSSSD